MGKNRPFQRRKVKYILERYENGDTMVDACDHYGVGTQSFYVALEHHDDLAKRYEAAKTARSRDLAEETIHIADTEKDPAKARNMINSRQWLAGKFNRREFGDHVVHEVEHKLSLADALEQGQNRLDSIRRAYKPQFPTGGQQAIAHAREASTIDLEATTVEPVDAEIDAEPQKYPDWLD